MVGCSCEKWDSGIAACERFLPDCSCCEFNKVRICLYPGEYENSKLSKGHLAIIKEDHFGGKLATCTKFCGANDLKPLDCKSYPFFPFFDGEGRLQLKRSSKCSLSKEELKEHGEKALIYWKEMIKDKKIVDWIKTVELVGYTYIIE